MTDAHVFVHDHEASHSIRINGPNPTFLLRSEAIRAAALSELDPVIADLLHIAAAVFAIDGSLRRGGPTRPHMGETWRRNLDFSIPVRKPDLWSSAKVTEALTDAVGFLTEDHVSFTFTQAEITADRQPYLALDPSGVAFNAEEVIMFSGGLDSFAGALEVLSNPSSKVVLVSHQSAQKIIPRQNELAAYLVSRFPGRVLHIPIIARRVLAEAKDTTQRSRSLLFAALGQAVAQSFSARRVNFFENGIISHNLPLSPQVVGTMASRTTHPLALLKLDHLMKMLLPNAAPIENRFQWLTKSEVVARIAQQGAEDQIRRAVSCTSVREQTRLHTHCGACSQCLDRRFALIAAGLEEQDPQEIYQTDVLLGERDADASITMAMEWTRHHLRTKDLDQASFMKEFGLEIARIIRGHPELDTQTALKMTIDLHHRQSKVVRDVFDLTIRDNSGALVLGKIPGSSLLKLVIADGAAKPGLPDDPRTSAPQPAFIPDISEVDLVPTKSKALRVAFWSDGKEQVVAVEGLGRVNGASARVPHGLKVQFLEDRLEGREPADHEFVAPGNIPGVESLTKEAVRAAVKRCRKSLALDYEAVHGEPPPDHLLVQTKSPKGYRLDPTIELIDPDQLR